MNTKSEALIIACSRAKRKPGEGIWEVEGASPAVWVYDGPWWKILRKQNPRVHVFALSAKFGLIPAHTLIPYYDLKMRNAPSVQWISNHVLQSALPLLTDFSAIWTCVPQIGGYSTACEILKAHLESKSVAIPFRDVTKVLDDPEDLRLLGRNPHFARTRALALFCRDRGRPSPMPTGEDAEDWQRLVDEGAILGW